MLIDLAAPPWNGIFVGIVLMAIAGIIKFTYISLAKKIAEQKLSNLISELDSLNKKYKEEITEIKQRDKEEKIKEILQAIKFYQQEVDKLLHRESPSSSLYETYIKATKTKD